VNKRILSKTAVGSILWAHFDSVVERESHQFTEFSKVRDSHEALREALESANIKIEMLRSDVRMLLDEDGREE